MSGLDYSTENLGAQALNTTAQLNQISNTYVGIWNLENTNSSIPVNVEFRSSQNAHSSNKIGGTDRRQRVAEADIAPGGRYRSIVKLFLRYASQRESDPWTIATGWLIAPDLIVTAGHSAFDWSHKMGRLAQVKVYVGYNGRASAWDPTSVQFQQGRQVATTTEWLKSKGFRGYNLAFIKVQNPFTGIVPIKFQDTPRSGISSLGVVGYAGDIVDFSTGEKGARMYESFSNTRWNLEDSEYTMLEYDIDSYGGNSGSPVLRKEDMVSIGTHVYGGSPSLASVIGLLGSPYENYVAAFSVDPKRSRTQPDGIKYVHISVTGSVPQVSNTEYTRQGNQYGSNTEYTRQETQYGNGNTESSTNEIGGWSQHGSNLNNDLSRDDVDVDFFQILKVGIRLSDPILSNILQVHQPMVLGSVGSPVGALAGAILSAAGKLATQSSSFAHEFRQGLDYDGIMERAILGEAAFCAVMSMKRRRLEELGVFSEMAKVVKLIAPATKKIAPFIMHTLTEPALRIALHALHNDADSHGAKSTIVNGSKSSFAQQTWPFSGTLDPDSENFFKRLWASCGNSGGSESSYDGVGKTVLVGFYNAGPILTTAAYEGLQTLATRLPDDASEGESIPGHHPFIVGLSERAMLGEAALQALMKVPKQRLDEGAFDIMARSVARIGQIVLQPAHGLIEDIESVVKGVVKDRSTRSASRRNKGFSYANLEREVLAYYRGQEEKQQPAVESYGRF